MVIKKFSFVRYSLLAMEAQESTASVTRAETETETYKHAH